MFNNAVAIAYLSPDKYVTTRAAAGAGNLWRIIAYTSRRYSICLARADFNLQEYVGRYINIQMLIDATYERWRVCVTKYTAGYIELIFHRLDGQPKSVGEWVIREITAQESARIDAAGFHIHRRAGVPADDFLRWLHKKVVDLPASADRSNLLKLLVVN